jgi:hypothetical protein
MQKSMGKYLKNYIFNLSNIYNKIFIFIILFLKSARRDAGWEGAGLLGGRVGGRVDDGFTTALLHDGGREGCGEGAGLLGGREVDS